MSDILDILNDPAKCLAHSVELLRSTSGEENSQINERNNDLSILTGGLHHTILSDPVKAVTDIRFVSTIKETIICAYLLGRRDSQSVPDVFSEPESE